MSTQMNASIEAHYSRYF